MENNIQLECQCLQIGSFVCKSNLILEIHPVGLLVCFKRRDGRSIKMSFKKSYIIKVFVCFSQSLPLILFKVTPGVSNKIRELLGMSFDQIEPDYHFDAESSQQAYNGIIFIVKEFTDDSANAIRTIYGDSLDIISSLEANEILSIEMNNIEIDSAGTDESIALIDDIDSKSENEAVEEVDNNNYLNKLLLSYPQNKPGAISITLHDYQCLNDGEFFNDNIIEFYLKYLFEETIGQQLKDRCHLFSTFFYRRLTTKLNNESNDINPSKIRHSRVKRWTKNVNIFQKDFIFVPINKSQHWFLAVICYPRLVKNEEILNVRKSSRKRKAIKIFEDEEIESERDEAEPSDDYNYYDDSEADDFEEQSEKKPLMQHPCIIIFDSLQTNGNRDKEFATLRDYLTYEYQEKFSNPKLFTANNLVGYLPKVPQQDNYWDCGPSLLQFVDSFLHNPIDDFNIPIKKLHNWFDKLVVIRKRETIAKLIFKLMNRYGLKTNIGIPNLMLPEFD